MGNLIKVSDFQNGNYDGNFYFPRKMNHIDGINQFYPFKIYVHGSIVSDSGPYKNWKIDLRKFVERRAAGDVILGYIEKDYYWFYDIEPESDYAKKSYKVDHHYYSLSFEFEEDQMQYSLTFPELCAYEVNDVHPDYESVSQEEISKRYRRHHYYDVV